MWNRYEVLKFACNPIQNRKSILTFDITTDSNELRFSCVLCIVYELENNKPETINNSRPNNYYLIILWTNKQTNKMNNQEIELRLQNIINLDVLANKQMALKTKRLYKKLHFLGEFFKIN